MAGSRPPPGEPRGAGARGRVRRRQIERSRARRRHGLLLAFAVAAVVVGAAAVVVFPPPPKPAGPPPGGPVISNVPMHIHPHLALFRDTQAATLPEDIGRNPARWVDHTLDIYLDPSQGSQGSLSPLHTHDNTGDIHVESSVTRAFTLGEFFAVWGQPVGPLRTVDLVPDSTHNLTLTVDGVASQAWGNLVLHEGQQIEVHYDTLA